MSEKSVEQLYQEREARVLAAARCEQPDRIPVFGPFQKYPYQFAGVTFKEAMNDYAGGVVGLPQIPGLLPARRRLRRLLNPAKAMEIYGWKAFKWPGHGLGDDDMYQYKDDEYMTAEEYDEFIYDPSGFMLGKWAPRQFSSMAGFAQTIPWRRFMWSGWMNLNFFWSTPEFQETLRTITAGAEEAGKWWASQFQYWGEAKDKGFPMSFAAGMAAVRHPRRHAARHAQHSRRHAPPPRQAARRGGSRHQDLHRVRLRCAAGAAIPFTWTWVHKSTREFMSDAQFKEFYWPYLRKGLMALIDKGIIPMI